jgi:hypothetical protein
MGHFLAISLDLFNSSLDNTFLMFRPFGRSLGGIGQP